MKKKLLLLSPLVTGTLSLVITGILSRCMGFVFRILMSYTLGEEGMGIFHLAMPILGIGMSVCGAGIQSALSRMVADYNQRIPGQDSYLLRMALLLSLSLSLIFGSTVYFLSDTIAQAFLQEPRCAGLLRMLAFSLPFSCIHSCYCGYYYGNQRTKQPALSQLVEQLIRVGTLLVIWAVRLGLSLEVTLVDAAFGTVISEAAASAYICHSRAGYRQLTKPRQVAYPGIFRELAKTSVPISGNRLVTTLLMSLESLMIPVCLRRYGLSPDQAISLYGVFTGMAMPFILFPATVPNSMAVLLLPKIAAVHSAGEKQRVASYSYTAILFALGLGCFCTVFFYLAGPFLGTFFFHSALAGSYIRLLALLCPFLYLGITCSSILNGLGKLTTVFVHTIISFVLRLISVFVLIPIGSLNGYLLGLLTAQLLLCALHLGSIRHAL